MASTKSFLQLGVASNLLATLTELGYEKPTPIQMQSIPALLSGHDIIAQAQTGTGKTAAFALAILTQLDLNKLKPQALILTPTRELAIQVAEAFQSYAKHLPNFHVIPIYGGQSYTIQLKALKRGAQVVIGTPGRIMDHLRRKTLITSALKTLVIDEADEMLKMGFIDDVDWILEQISQQHQIALFSATMPLPIQKIAQKYLHNPLTIQIQSNTKTVAAIQQFYTLVSNQYKLEALTRFLEIEDFEAALIFVRTKLETINLAEKLGARGYHVMALNGDIKQSERERIITKLKNGQLDLVVATDVAARGIDIERMSYVINYDLPSDSESYIHRIGRTGRAGREGKALLFISPREIQSLKYIERSIGQQITEIKPPSANNITEKRIQQLMEKIIAVINKGELEPYYFSVEQIMKQYNYNALDIAAALSYLTQQKNPIQIEEKSFIDKNEHLPSTNKKNHSKNKSRPRKFTRKKFNKNSN
ncbi:MAG: DEAD/DEAH box helicase [Gammaproteobacteria bacterium RIFCSPHIGHO2_12_FULL_35_23]|nr:MAG: DEAD/DEAH box helicase [Gammaproteobacteria bacterium RIFCSPHIGHO2_12_FULL_35_23]